MNRHLRATRRILTLAAAVVLLTGAAPPCRPTADIALLVEDAAAAVRSYTEPGVRLSAAEADVLVHEVHPLMRQVQTCYAESTGYPYPENVRLTNDCAARLTAPLARALAHLDALRPTVAVAATLPSTS